jgi:hypothetical protein
VLSLVVVLREAFGAEATAEWLFTCMGPHMVHKVVFFRELLPTSSDEALNELPEMLCFIVESVDYLVGCLVLFIGDWLTFN